MTQSTVMQTQQVLLPGDPAGLWPPGIQARAQLELLRALELLVSPKGLGLGPLNLASELGLSSGMLSCCWLSPGVGWETGFLDSPATS